MKKPLRVLIVEDSAFDAQMLVTVLKKAGYDLTFERVETAEQMRDLLNSRPWDLVLSDYNLPHFSGKAALEILHQSGQDLPFIIVSGTIGEHTAVEAMKAGAHDYLMKGNLARLIPAVERELREAANRAGRRETREALRQSELRYRLLWETATDAIILIDTESKILFANPAVEEIFGHKPEELVGQSLTILQPEGLRTLHREGVKRYLRTGEKRLNWRATETVGLKKDGTEFPIEVAFSDMAMEGQRWFVGFIRDVTARKKAEQELQENQEQFRVARDIQQHLFPKAPPDLPGFDIAGASKPAEATGGDYFDYIQMLDGRVGVVVGDVTGHGVGPALLMAETRAYLRILARNRPDLGEILTRANLVLAEDVGYERFITLLFVQLNPATRQLQYVNAGHPSGYIFDANGEIKTVLKRTGIPLGLKPDNTYASAGPIELEPGELVLMLTDGFEEAVSADDRTFGVERALEVVREHRAEPAAGIVDSLFQALHDFSPDTPQSDDLTMVIIKVEGVKS
ncbi:MAG: SpoIIE family protein phosphatase [Verrucomicrobiota bacterium]